MEDDDDGSPQVVPTASGCSSQVFSVGHRPLKRDMKRTLKGVRDVMGTRGDRLKEEESFRGTTRVTGTGEGERMRARAS